MLNLLKKSVLIAIISVLLLAPMMPVTYAADEDAPAAAPAAPENPDLAKFKAALDDIKANPCVDPGEGGKDAGYIITFIEEPLDTQDTSDAGGDFIYRPCFRNTLQFTDPTDPNKAKTEILSFLSRGPAPNTNGCSAKAQALLEDPAMVRDYNVRYSCKEIQAILSKGGTALIYGYIGMIYKWAASIVGVISITVIILSGIQMSASGGDPEALSKAKTRIVQSLAGIIILFLSGIILNTINPNFFTS